MDKLEQIVTRKGEASREIINVDEAEVKLVIFLLGEECYAFHGAFIREILAQPEIYFVPGCPASLEGVINVRGEIESVIRIDTLLRISRTEESKTGTILLAQSGGIQSGIRVDRVIDVADVIQSRIQPPSATLPDHLRPLVAGVLDFNGRAVTLLDVDGVLRDYASGNG